MKQKSLLQTKVSTKVSLTLGIGAIGLLAVILTFGPALFKENNSGLVNRGGNSSGQILENNPDATPGWGSAASSCCQRSDGYNGINTAGTCIKGACGTAYKMESGKVFKSVQRVDGTWTRWTRN
ncbi:MAG: hypothetical protein WCX88_00250 [Patescibacteria group bacterium]